MLNIAVYYLVEDNHLIEISEWVKELQSTFEFHVEYIDVSKLSKENNRKFYTLPTIIIDPYTLQYPFTYQQLEISLRAASDREKQVTKIENNFIASSTAGKKITGADRFSLWFTKNYMFFFIGTLFLYVTTPFLAPVFMKFGLKLPAKVIYTIYSPLCHQLPFRSFFLFGEQFYYPRELAGISEVISFEDITGNNNINILEDRYITGEDQYPKMGYKVAICQRCVAIYCAMFIMSVIFTLSKRKIKSIPWYIWVFVGVLPMGLDGISQLPGAIANVLPAWLPIRESTPWLRVITGGLFGITTAWFLFPMIEETLSENRRFLERRFDYYTNSK